MVSKLYYRLNQLILSYTFFNPQRKKKTKSLHKNNNTDKEKPSVCVLPVLVLYLGPCD